jgi:hypothetical protein
MPKQSRKPNAQRELKKLQTEVALTDLALTIANAEIEDRATYARQYFAAADDQEKERLVSSITDFIKDGDHDLSVACAALGVPEAIYHEIRTKQQLRNFGLDK